MVFEFFAASEVGAAAAMGIMVPRLPHVDVLPQSGVVKSEDGVDLGHSA